MMRKKTINSYLNEEHTIYEFNYDEIAESELKKTLENKIESDIRMKIIPGLAMSVKLKYRIYYLFETNLDIYHYLLKNSEREITSTIEMSNIFVDPNLIKAKLYDGRIKYDYHDWEKTIMLNDVRETGYNLNGFNKDFYTICEQRAFEKICDKHTIRLNDKQYRLDLDLYNLTYKRNHIFIEPIYEIVIPYQMGRKTMEYISVYSLVRQKFDVFSYPFHKDYLEYLKINRSFMAKVNEDLDEFYYRDKYESYLESIKEISHYRLKQHVKTFADNENEELSTRYSKVGYFFFNNKRYISNAIKLKECETFNEELYHIMLLAKVDGEANLKLAAMAEKHLLSKVKRSKELKLKYLLAAAKYKEGKAYEKLYDHYLKQAYKDDSQANYYLKLSRE